MCEGGVGWKVCVQVGGVGGCGRRRGGVGVCVREWVGVDVCVCEGRDVKRSCGSGQRWSVRSPPTHVGSLAKLRKRQTFSIEPFSSKSCLKKRAVSLFT